MTKRLSDAEKARRKVEREKREIKEGKPFLSQEGAIMRAGNWQGKNGRPAKIETVEELLEGWNSYKEDCRERGAKLTMTGLANLLCISRTTLVNMKHRDEEMKFIIERIKGEVEQQMEENLLAGKSPIGHIFALKNNHGWEDTRKVETKNETNIINILSTLRPPGEEDVVEMGEIVEDIWEEQ